MTGPIAIRIVDEFYELADVDQSAAQDGKYLVTQNGKVVGVDAPPAVDRTYVHTQSVASDTWVVQHNLGKYPSITVVDSSRREVEGAVEHDSINQTTITFSAPFSGQCFCN